MKYYNEANKDCPVCHGNGERCPYYEIKKLDKILEANGVHVKPTNEDKGSPIKTKDQE